MPTDRITSTSTLIETLQAMASSRPAGFRRGGDAKPSVNAATRHDVGALRQRLRNVVADADDAESVVNARNIAVCEILLWEFGSEFRNDSQFSPMVDAIGKAFDTDPGLQQRFIDLMADLRKP